MGPLSHHTRPTCIDLIKKKKMLRLKEVPEFTSAQFSNVRWELGVHIFNTVDAKQCEHRCLIESLFAAYYKWGALALVSLNKCWCRVHNATLYPGTGFESAQRRTQNNNINNNNHLLRSHAYHFSSFVYDTLMIYIYIVRMQWSRCQLRLKLLLWQMRRDTCKTTHLTVSQHQ